MKRNFYFTDLPKIASRGALKSFLLLFVLFLGVNLSAQTITGNVKDADTGEALIGASVGYRNKHRRRTIVIINITNRKIQITIAY